MKKVLLICLIMLFGGVIEAHAVDLPVLMYHSVDNTGGMYAVTAEKLESDIISLKDAGFTPVSFDEVINYVHQGAELPEKPVVITFDDGYENNCSVLLPMAERLDFKFEVFTVAGFIHYGPYAMEWDQVAQVNNSYHGSIGCHTHNLHSYIQDGRLGVVRMPGEPFRQWENILRSDLTIAKNLFIDNTGYAPRTFAYPFGNFSAEADRILREEGYLVTVTTETGVNRVEKGDLESLYLMMRISMDGKRASAAEEIAKYSDLYYSERIANEKSLVWSEVNVSRREVLKVLYGNLFANTGADLSFIAGYYDLKHENTETRELFAKCVQNNIVSGYPDWTMRPGSYITRGEFAVMLARRTGYDGRAVSHRYVDSASWNDWALSWCYEKGYMIGYGDSFGVNDFLTKEQIDLVCERAGL